MAFFFIYTKIYKILNSIFYFYGAVSWAASQIIVNSCARSTDVLAFHSQSQNVRFGFSCDEIFQLKRRYLFFSVGTKSEREAARASVRERVRARVKVT